MSDGRPRDPRRSLPSVDSMLRSGEAARLASVWGRETLTKALREALSVARAGVESGTGLPSEEELLAEVRRLLPSDRPSLRAVVNATGVILHTNLGRAPLAADAIRAAAEVAGGYSTLEYDLDAGERGDRSRHCTDLVGRLTGAEASLVVNNNAAAVSLAINTLARGRDVLVSRGELVEIGGGFRIPDVIERSGAFLCAVGTTNRTRVDDYRRAVTPSTGLILKIHPSNYRVECFAEEASLEDLVRLGRETKLPVMHDLGSGLLLSRGLPVLGEPVVQASVSSGADVVTWSGDKLLGGPQAGIIHGRSDLVDRMRANALLRAFRVDKSTLAALEATLRLHLVPERALMDVPVLRMLSESPEEVEGRARAATGGISGEAAERVSIASMRSVLGGGAAPGIELESFGWVVSGLPHRIDSALRGQDPPVVGRIEAERFLLDFRTVMQGQERLVAAAVERVVEEEGASS